MRTLLVLYDSRCPFCVRCRQWLESAAQLVALRFLCCRSELARTRFGRIDGLGEELVVVAEDGGYWVGPEAFLVCLWALDFGRELSEVLHTRPFWWLARAVFGELSAQRSLLGKALGAPCHDGHCAVLPRPASPYR